MDREKKRLTRESERERERERERQRERQKWQKWQRESKKKLIKTFGQRLKKQNLSIYGRFLCRCRVYGSLIIPNKQTRVM